MIVVFLVGTVFFIFGGLLLLVNIHFYQNGKILSAKIIGIEKYITTGQKNKRQLMYRPLIEYHFNGALVRFSTSIGTNSISYRIGEKVKVLSLHKGAEYVRLNSKLWWVFPSVFFLAGFAMCFGYFMSNQSSMNKIIVVVVVTCAIAFGHYRLKSKGLLDKIVDDFLKAKLEDDETLVGRDIFLSQNDILSENKNNFKIPMLITSILLGLSSYGIHFFYQTMKPKSIEYIHKVLENPQMLESFKAYTADQALLGFVLCIIFSPLFIYSVLYQYRKLNSL